MRATAIAVSIALAVLLASAVPVGAKDMVTIEVTSIAASSDTSRVKAAAESADQIDSRLSALARKLRALFAYSHYSFLDQCRSRADFGGSCIIELPEHFSLQVEPARIKKGEDDKLELTVTFMRDIQVEGVAGREGDGRTGHDIGHTRGAPGRGRPEKEIVLRTKIRLENGGTVLLGGPAIGDGVLILALSARA